MSVIANDGSNLLTSSMFVVITFGRPGQAPLAALTAVPQELHFGWLPPGSSQAPMLK